MQGDGNELREHYKSIWRQTGEKPKELENQCPEAFQYLWDYFDQLNGARTSNGFGANPLSYSEIQCWRSLMDIDLTPNEVTILKYLDNEWLVHQGKQAQKRAKKNG